MADQQNPIQNDNQTTPTGTAGTPAPDMLGDISFTLPTAPENDQKTSDVADMLLEKNIDNVQQKAEELPTNPSTDPTDIDLGDITIGDSTDVEVPTKEDSSNSAEMFKSPDSVVSSDTASASSDLPSVDFTMPSSAPAVDLSTIPAAPATENSAVTTEPATQMADLSGIDMSLGDVPTSLDNTIPTAPAVESIPVTEGQNNETPSNAEPIITPTENQDAMPIEISLPEEKTDSMVDSLTSNEEAKLSATAEQNQMQPEPSSAPSPFVATETPANPNTMIAPTPSTEGKTDAANGGINLSDDDDANNGGMDLDSLTNDLTPRSPEEEAAINAANVSGSEVAPVVASVTLPDATLVKPAAPAKKKAMMMIGAFLALLIVGGGVFYVMMPEEANSLLASITGAPAEQPALIIQRPVAINTGNSTTGTTNTGAAMTGMNMTGTDVSMTTGTDIMSGATIDTGDNTTLEMSLEQANMLATTLEQQSKKSLIEAKLNDKKDAETALYKVFKDSSALVDTLEKTTDISTIPDIAAQITALQQSLSQANTLLHGGNNNAQPQ